MLTDSARRAGTARTAFGTVLSRAELGDATGLRSWDVRRQIQANRWRMAGRAVVLHTGPLSRREREQVALVNCGPRALLTSFTALERQGLRDWSRDVIHVLVPAGVPRPAVDGLEVRIHRVADWSTVEGRQARRLHRVAPAAVVAAGGMTTPRGACGLFAAVVQQRLARAQDLRQAVEVSTRLRNRAQLLLALADIEMGAEALGEIDFVRLCRRHGLPEPNLQAVRLDANGRRRYLDAAWELPDGRRLAVEVDGAVHLAPARWFADQLRQNDVTVSGTQLLRYPSVVVRTEEAVVVGQLIRGLGGRR